MLHSDSITWNGTFRSASMRGMPASDNLVGRRAEAARNDERILAAAREVFMRDPHLPVAAVADHAGVGMSALYRRFASKEALLQRLATDGLRTYVSVAQRALVPEDDPWAAFESFMLHAVDAGAGSLSQRFAGQFVPTPELRDLGQRAYQLTDRLVKRTRAAGLLRHDVEVADIALILELVQAVRVPDPERNAQLRQRYMRLVLDGLHAARAAQRLPGQPPTWPELTTRYG